MKTHVFARCPMLPLLARRLGAALPLLAACGAAQAQTWTRVAHNPPAAISLMLLLSDGTVMAAGNSGSTIQRTWYRLTPDAQGSYINGTWTTLAQMHDTRLYYSSQVLKDGRVFVAGGEYGTGTARAEIYDPVTNIWTQVNPPTSLLDPSQPSANSSTTQRFYDSNSEILPDGKILIAPVLPKVSGQPLIYDPVANVWSAGPRYFRGIYQDETAWVKLRDDTVLTMDPFGASTYGTGVNPSERYDPVSNTWINDANVPVTLFDPFGFELGGGLLLPDGRAFYLGSTGQTALYTPSGTTTPGSWVAGPPIPGSHGTPDAPSAMMVNGKILCAVSPLPTSANHFPTPTTFYEYDYVANAFTSVSAPAGTSDPIPSYQGAMLCLPDGSVIYSHMQTSVYVYTPAGAPLADGKPTVNSVTPNPDGSFHVEGTGFNGISQGATYGDDLQMSSNYPLVRLTDGSAHVYYARTFNWSSTGVQTGELVVGTEYVLPASLPPGQYSLQLIANGFASDPFCTTPLVSDVPQAQTACVGDAASFSVTASGSSLSYQWRRGTTPLVNSGNISGADSSTLIIDPVTAADAGADYNVVVFNGCGTTTTSDVELVVDPNCPPTCYANCDGSTAAPILNVNDFICFQSAFAAGDSYANCDGSSTPPVLNVNDFICFQSSFAIGCP